MPIHKAMSGFPCAVSFESFALFVDEPGRPKRRQTRQRDMHAECAYVIHPFSFAFAHAHEIRSHCEATPLIIVTADYAGLVIYD